MRFPTEILIFQWIGMVFIPLSETAITQPPNPLKVNVGEAVNFTWTSDVPKILLAIWGVGSGDSPSPQYIYVDASENPNTNDALDDDLKRRLKYTGNLAQGRAWFVIKNATVSDSSTYIANIREHGLNTKSYYVRVIVEPKVTTTSTPSSTVSSSDSTVDPTDPSGTTTATPTTGSTPPPGTKPTTSSQGLSGGEIAGIGIGGSCGCIGIAIIGWFVYKKFFKKRQPDNLPADKNQDTEMNSPPAVKA